MNYVDPVIRWMRAHDQPMTRDVYLALNFGCNEPDDLGPEWEWPLLLVGGTDLEES